jgi:membrane protein implicated in regulation of membrane protease activity
MSTPPIDNLIQHEIGAVKWYLIWFVSALGIGVALIVAYMLALLEEKIGLAIGSALFLLFSKPPLSEMLKRRDRIGALKALRTRATSLTPGDPDEMKIKETLEKLVQKMLEG